MRQIFSLLAISSMLIFLSCSTEYVGHVGGASDPTHCDAPSSVLDTDSDVTSPLLFDTSSTVSSADYTSGCQIYVEKCANCHMLDGLAKNIELALGDATAQHELDDVDTLCTACEVGSWLGPRIATDMPPLRGDSVHLSEEDAAKVAVYIRAEFFNDITPSNDQTPANLPESMRPDENIVNTRGQQLYGDRFCSACHGADGESGSYGKAMTAYTIDKATLIGKLDGTGLGVVAGYGSPDAIMNNGGNAADNDDIAEYMNEAFGYGWYEE